jgi:hypothetical protein
LLVYARPIVSGLFPETEADDFLVCDLPDYEICLPFIGLVGPDRIFSEAQTTTQYVWPESRDWQE